MEVGVYFSLKESGFPHGFFKLSNLLSLMKTLSLDVGQTLSLVVWTLLCLFFFFFELTKL